MASKKQHAAIDFQGAARITVGGSAGSSGQVLTSGGTGAMTWTAKSSGGVTKYVRSILWKSVQSNVSYTGSADPYTCTLTHGIGSTYVQVSMVDVVGTMSEAGANGIVDLDFLCEVTIVDSNNIRFIFSGNTQPSYGDEYKVTVIG